MAITAWSRQLIWRARGAKWWFSNGASSPGGCAVTEEVWPGYRVSTAAYLTSLLQERIIRELDLPRYGYQVDAKDPAFFSPFPDDRYLFFWQDGRRTLEEIAKFSPRDAERFTAYEEHLERLSEVVEGLLLTTPPEFPPRGIGDIVDYLKLTPRLRRLGRRDMIALVKVFTMSAADFLDEWFESDEVKVTLATDGVIGANGGPRSPGTAYILLHHVMGSVGGKRGLWGFVRGGMGAVSNAIASAAKAHGAEIRTGVSVSHIRVENGRAKSVVLEGGEEIAAKAVASNLDPKRTFLDLLDAKRAAARIRGAHSQLSDRKGRRAKSIWRSAAFPIFALCRALPRRSIRRPCTSARPSSTSSGRGMARSTVDRRSGPCWS